MIVELLEDVPCDTEVVEACKELVAAGYRLALDDYVYADESLPLLELASIVKVDILDKTPSEIEAITRQLRRLRPTGVQLLAERVETARRPPTTAPSSDTTCFRAISSAGRKR